MPLGCSDASCHLLHCVIEYFILTFFGLIEFTLNTYFSCLTDASRFFQSHATHRTFEQCTRVLAQTWTTHPRSLTHREHTVQYSVRMRSYAFQFTDHTYF